MTQKVVEKVEALKKNKLKAEKVKSRKVKALKEFQPQFRDVFANKMVAEINGLGRVDKDKKILLKYGKFQIVRFMLRKGHKYTAYKNLESGYC
jgi:hypothetical protein